MNTNKIFSGCSKNFLFNNIDSGSLYLTTKKNIKEIKLNIIKTQKEYKYSNNLLSIIKILNKKQRKDINNIILHFNNNELYYFLNFFATLQKYSKNNIFYDKYLSLIFLIFKDKIIKSKNGCIYNLLLLKHNKYFGIYNSFLRYNISAIKYLYFLGNNDIDDDINNNDTINYLIIHKLIKNNENNKNINLNDYFLSMSNNYLIIY